MKLTKLLVVTQVILTIPSNEECLLKAAILFFTLAPTFDVLLDCDAGLLARVIGSSIMSYPSIESQLTSAESLLKADTLLLERLLAAVT